MGFITLHNSKQQTVLADAVFLLDETLVAFPSSGHDKMNTV